MCALKGSVFFLAKGVPNPDNDISEDSEVDYRLEKKYILLTL